MNFEGQCAIKLMHGYQNWSRHATCHQPQFANKARISNNPHKNSGFFHFVIFASQEHEQQHFYLDTVGLKLYSLWGCLKTFNRVVKNLKMPKDI